LEELLASDAPATAKVKAATELLGRLEPPMGRTSKAAAVKLAKESWRTSTTRRRWARAKLSDLLATRAPGVRKPGGKPARSEAWAVEVRRALEELERVVVDCSWKEPIVRYVEERARELTQDAERRAVEAEARLAEFTGRSTFRLAARRRTLPAGPRARSRSPKLSSAR
jgi:hypothetical protein